MKNYILTIALSLIALTGSAEITDKDKILNQNIKQYRPIYCTQKKIPVTYWKSKYEFIIELVHPQLALPKPPSDIKNTFLGYRNRDTKVKVLCNRVDPTYGKILGTYDLGIFEINEFQTTIPFKIPDRTIYDELNIHLAIKRNKLDIEVVDSGKFIGMFKKYAPSTIYNIDFNITTKTRKRRK